MDDYIREEDGRTVCGKCGHVFGLAGGVKEWPFCPHGETEHGAAINRDEIPGGIVLENYGPHPIRFDSHSERRRHMKTMGLEEKEKFCPLPGTDKDPQGIPNPKGYLDQQTLANAAELICRNGVQKEWDPIEAGVLTNMTSGFMTKRDAKAVAEGDVHRMSRLGRRMNRG